MCFTCVVIMDLLALWCYCLMIVIWCYAILLCPVLSLNCIICVCVAYVFLCLANDPLRCDHVSCNGFHMVSVMALRVAYNVIWLSDDSMQCHYVSCGLPLNLIRYKAIAMCVSMLVLWTYAMSLGCLCFCCYGFSYVFMWLQKSLYACHMNQCACVTVLWFLLWLCATCGCFLWLTNHSTRLA